MAQSYSWQQAPSEPSYRSENRDNLGWWAAAAMLVSILLHVIVFFALDQVKIVLGISEPQDLNTRVVVNREQVQEEFVPRDFIPPPPPDDTVAPPPQDTAKLLDDIDLLPLIKDQEIEMRPDIDETTIAVAPGAPVAEKGDPRAISVDATAGLTTDLDLPDFGRQEFEMKPAAIGQITVDPGSSKADDADLSKFTEDLIKKGAGGKADKGMLNGLTTLDDMIGLAPNQLVGAKTMLPSDLLFEFNKFDLRESAKVNLYKLGLVLDKNPDMYCWIEGHTDLIGGDAPNLELSVRRAQAVKDYLVNSMKFEPERIYVRGYGRFQPLVTGGDKDQQSSNRRVEIKMQKTPPTDEQMKIAPPKAAPIEETPPAPKPEPAPPAMREEPAPPRAVLVKPDPETARRVQVVDPPVRNAPKAMPVEEAPPRAKPVPAEPEMPAAPAKAVPVEEDPPVLRAVPVAE